MPGLILSAPLALLALAPTLINAQNFDCDHVRADSVSWDLSPLKGPRTVWHSQSEPPSVSNTTFTIDLCSPLKKDSSLEKDEQCATGTRICAVQRQRNVVEDTKWTVGKVKSIAGSFQGTNGRNLDPDVERLKGGKSSGDFEREGLRVTLGGGKYPDRKSGITQKAVIEFVCDQKREGDKKGEKDGEGSEERKREEGGKEADEDGDERTGGDDQDLKFISYKLEESNKDGGAEVLRLSWTTKYACEEVEDDGSIAKGGWGFFGWLFFVVFLGAAAYIIFGSWLNYSRYGARGWDLVPHGDTIRDLPYIVKDWGRSVVDTVQGRGYRGGYSAV